MCKAVKKITLCTCMTNNVMGNIAHHKHSRKNKNNASTTYKWTLYQYKGTYDSGMDGLFAAPSDMLHEAITNDTMLHELNERNCFDFEYTPSDGDLLHVYKDVKNADAFLSFIFKTDKWVCDSYNSFDIKTEKLNYGVVAVKK